MGSHLMNPNPTGSKFKPTRGGGEGYPSSCITLRLDHDRTLCVQGQQRGETGLPEGRHQGHTETQVVRRVQLGR